MRIKRVLIRNFRSFDGEGIEIEFPKINLPFSLVGHNNSGKSNFVSSVLYGLAVKSVTENTFSPQDFYFQDKTQNILIEVELDPPIKSASAYNKIADMSIAQLKVKDNEGVFEISHYFCDENRKAIFNPKAIKRSKKAEYSPEEMEVLTELQKKGAENVFKWRSKIPVHFIDTSNIHYQLRINRNTLIGKVMLDVTRDFESKENIIEKKRGVVEGHVGKPRFEIFENAMRYLEEHVISTKKLEYLIEKIEEVIREQLELEEENFSIKFGLPSADTFFDNLTFYLTDNPEKPKLPINYMGNGFISLFVVALFRAINHTDQGGNIFIIEEPETFLHEHFQEYFYKVLCDLAQNNQIIYTTHSKKFVNLFEPQTIIKFQNSENLATRIIYKESPSIQFPESIEEFKLENPADFPKYLRTLEPNLGNIIFANRVLVVEGPHDLLAYKTVLENKFNFGLKNGSSY